MSRISTAERGLPWAVSRLRGQHLAEVMPELNRRAFARTTSELRK